MMTKFVEGGGKMCRGARQGHAKRYLAHVFEPRHSSVDDYFFSDTHRRSENGDLIKRLILPALLRI